MKVRVTELTRSQFSIHALDALFTRPIFSSTDFAERTTIPKASAARILAALREAEVVVPLVEGKGRRAGIFIFSEPIRLVEI